MGDRLSGDIYNMLYELIETIVGDHFLDAEYEAIQDKMIRMLAVDATVDREKWSALGEDGLVELLVNQSLEVYKNKTRMLSEPFLRILKQIQESDVPNKPTSVQIIFNDGIKRMRVVVEVTKAMETEGRELVHAMERAAVLSVIDDKWMEHLRELDSVKEGIGLRAFGQKDPLLEYKREAFNMFTELVQEINQEVISTIWKAMPEGANDQQQLTQAKAPVKRKIDMSSLRTQHDEVPNMSVQLGGGQKQGPPGLATGGKPRKPEPVVVTDKVGRNDPCPCGSGKKFKHCHGQNA